MKTCKECHVPKPLDAFQRHKKAVDGHIGVCKSCMAKARRSTMASNGTTCSNRNELPTPEDIERMKAELDPRPTWIRKRDDSKDVVAIESHNGEAWTPDMDADTVPEWAECR
jgi:hypothetical protein